MYILGQMLKLHFEILPAVPASFSSKQRKQFHSQLYCKDNCSQHAVSESKDWWIIFMQKFRHCKRCMHKFYFVIYILKTEALFFISWLSVLKHFSPTELRERDLHVFHYLRNEQLNSNHSFSNCCKSNLNCIRKYYFLPSLTNILESWCTVFFIKHFKS